ncbi:MAG: hypothetical protein R3C59_16630 [Planctomycetaceae bacterium]
MSTVVCRPVSPASLRCRCISAFIIVIAGCLSGCGSDSDALAGRVAIEVSVQIDGTPVTDGTLVLRPEPGLRCPLIPVPVVAGVGRLEESAGPVPGAYQATYRPSAAGADISEHLTNTGRVDPTSAKSNKRPAVGVPTGVVTPKRPIPLTIPNSNPATLTAAFSSS